MVGRILRTQRRRRAFERVVRRTRVGERERRFDNQQMRLGDPLGAIALNATGAGAYAGTRIEGNIIGADASGTLPLPNGGTPGTPQPAVSVAGNAACDLVIAGNTIAYNRLTLVATDADGNTSEVATEAIFADPFDARIHRAVTDVAPA